MLSSEQLRPERMMTAAELAGTRNRISIAPDLVREIAEQLGYDKESAFAGDGVTSLSNFYDIPDYLELVLRAKLGELRLSNSAEQKAEMDKANQLLRRIAKGEYLTREQIHKELPPETVVLFKMGPPRLWGYAVRQRVPSDAERAIPASFHEDPTGPYTDPKEAWLGVHVADATNLHALETRVSDVPIDDDRYQRLRLGMGLVDEFDQVWSSARGHWHISPDTRYIVPSRYGWCPFVFKIADDGWRRDEFEGSRDRYMATHGYFIDIENERLIELGEPDPDRCWLPKMKVSELAPSERDLAVAEALTDKIIALGASQRNPVIRLRQSGRRLFK